MKKANKKPISENDARLVSGILTLFQATSIAVLALIASYSFSIIASAGYALGYSVVNCEPNCPSEKYTNISNTINAQLGVLETATLFIALAVAISFVFELLLLKRLNLKKIITILVISLVFIMATYKAEPIFSNLILIAL